MTTREIGRSLRLLFRRAQAEREFADELSHHAEMRARELISAGVDPAEARRRAESEMGGTTRLTQDLRDVHGVAFARVVELLLTDVRLAARRIARAPGFATAIIASVAIAIGANATIYTAVKSLLMDGFSVPAVDRLVWLSSSAPHEPAGGGLHDWEAQAAARRHDVFASVAVIGDRSLVRKVGSQRSRWRGMWVTHQLTQVLQIRAAFGRSFAPSDIGAGVRPMMISHERWATDLGSDSSVVGRIMRFDDDKSFLVVGILPRGLEFPFGRAPRSGDGAGYRAGVQDFWFLGQDGPELPGGTAIARLAAGVSIERAATTVRTNSTQRPPGADSLRIARVTPAREQALGIAAPGLRLAQAFAVLLLILASANLANLMLLRLRGRTAEFAVMAALGGSRRAVFRMIVVEATLLVAFGAVAGCVVAFFAPLLFDFLSAGTMPMLDRIRMDWSVAAYSASAALTVAVIAGLLPAFLVSRQPLASAITIGSRLQTDDGRMRRFRSALVVAQVALAFVLSVGAGLITTGFSRLAAVDTGYDPSGVIAAEIEVFDHPNVVGYYRQLDRRLRAIPGVEAVGIIHSTPLTGKWSFTNPFTITGRIYPPEGAPHIAGSLVAFDYFGAMRIPIVLGRSFTDAEYTHGDAPVMMINESAARRFFPNENPLDHSVQLGSKARRIVGVVKDSRDVRLDAPGEPMWYQPTFGSSNQLMVRASRPIEEVLPAVRRELLASDAGLVIERIGPFEEIVAGTLGERRLAMRLVTILASLSTALCVVGLYGVLAYAVRQRRREFGVRSALGAPRHALLAGVLRVGLSLAGFGLLVGLAAALAGTRLISNLLYDVQPTDVKTFASMVAIFLLTAAAASALPGIAAMRTDPAIALRDE